MTIEISLSGFSAKKLMAAATAAAILLGVPGPFAVSAAAQAFTAGAARSATAVSSIAGGASAVRPLSGSILAPMSAPALSVLNAPAVLAGAPSALIAAPAASAASFPAAAAAPSAANAPAVAAFPAASAAAAPAAALSSGRALAANLADAAKPGADGAKAATVLDSFYSGLASAAPCIFASLGRDSKNTSGLSPAAAPAGMPAPSAAPLPGPDTRFQVGRVHYAAMKVMGWIWKKWDDKLDHKWWTLNPLVGSAYIYFNEQALRLRVRDTSALLAPSASQPAPAAGEQKNHRSADGSNLDETRPGMAMAGTPFNQLIVPAGSQANANVDKMDPNPYVVSEKLQKRDRDADGNPIIKEAGILNNWAAGHIQFVIHDLLNHKRRPISENPMIFPIPAGHPMAAGGAKQAVLDRTETDPNLPKDYRGPAVHQNEETAAWDMSSIYGSSLERQLKVRSMKDGKLKIGADNRLLDDPEKPGAPLTGFNDNMTPLLAMLHTVWTIEHNHVADAVKAEHPDWNDERIFQMARLRVSALNARLHTTEWTRALLPNEILQSGMWEDWYGFVGKRVKNWVIRFSYRHPTAGRILGKLVRSEVVFGIPGTKTQHYGVNYNFVEEFPEVYRLHSLIRDSYKIQSLRKNPDGTVEAKLLASLKLEDANGFKTIGVLREFSGQDLAFSYGSESSGALTINNSPDALRALTTQDGRKIDLGAVDIIRARERLVDYRYVDFVKALGETPPATFEELTGDQATADKLRAVYKRVEDVDFNIGILAEKKPDAFALGNRQFKVFVLSAPARLKNDRFLSEQYDASIYGESGMEYIEHNNFGDVLARAWPGLRDADVEALENGYAPWAAPGTLLDRTAKEAATAQASAKNKIMNASFAAVAIAYLLSPLGLVGRATIVSLAIPFVAANLAVRQYASAQSQMAAAAAQAKDAPGDALIGSEAATKSARRGKLLGSIGAFTLLDVGGMIAFHLFAAHPIGALIIGATSVYFGTAALKAGRRYVEALDTQRVALKNTLTLGATARSAADLPGETAIQKRYWFLLGGKKSPVATLSDSYAALTKSGLPKWQAFTTAALSHLSFARKTQKNMTAAEKARWNPDLFDIYVPNIIDASGYSNTNVYSDGSNPVVKKGDVDMAEFERLFREFGMRDYLTAYDLTRIREANQYRDAQAGRGNWFSRLKGRLAAKRRADQLLQIFADKVVWEDELHGRHVPAITRERLLQVYQGPAQYQLMDERAAAQKK
jgi:hypothetical protein